MVNQINSVYNLIRLHNLKHFYRIFGNLSCIPNFKLLILRLQIILNLKHKKKYCFEEIFQGKKKKISI